MARPERRNAFDAALIDELAAAFADVGDARAVLLTGDGPSFSAGADVEWMRSSADLSYEENVADALQLRAMLEASDGCPAPAVARVQGHSLGRAGAGEGVSRGSRRAGEAAGRIAQHRTGEEGQGGLRAFREKRAASWRN